MINFRPTESVPAGISAAPRSALKARSRVRRALGASLVLAASFLVALSGGGEAIAQSTSKSKPKETDRQKEGRGVVSKPAGRSAPGGWCIVLEAFIGPRAVEEAQARLSAVAQNIGRSDVFVRKTARGAAIVAGSYPSPDSPQSRADLEAVRRAVVRGETLYSRAFFAPPEGSEDPGQVPELNLLTARSTFGSQAQYTLQIAVYEAPDRARAKRTAEEAALRLRRDGELAFYYHGPARSSVTVGVFSDKDFDAALMPKNPALDALQRRYPHNLLNGQYPILEKGPAGDERKQPSTLVQIPE